MRGRMTACNQVSGKTIVTLELPLVASDKLAPICGGEIDCEIDKHRERRSLNSNRYMWELVSRIAERMTPPLSKDECYITMLERYGQSVLLEVDIRAVPALYRAYRYLIYEGCTDDDTAQIRACIGSSEYNTTEMSRLLEGIKYEAEQLGIDTDLPQIRALIDSN